VAGLINEEDLATVRERSRIEDVVASYVTLRPAGGGSLSGLCPFHDEKTPSFRVTPARGFYHCFGCGEGGDVIGFVQKINNVGFAEAVEFLADRIGLHLRYTDDSGGNRPEPGLRLRILEANRLAAEYYTDQLLEAGAVAGRQFLADRGFDREVAERFGVGFAPRGSRTRNSSGLGWCARAAGTSSRAGCCGRSGTRDGRCSASAPGGCSTTTGCRPSTSTPPKLRCTASRPCCTGSTWRGPTSPSATRR
jgi:DNA primase catalytic core